jgi:nucleoside-diphosphate-sugar epimerase
MAADTAPARVLVLGLGYAGRHLATLLQAHGIACSGTVRDLAITPADGVPRHRLAEGNPLEAALHEAIRTADAILCSVPPDAGGDPALRLLGEALHDAPSLRWVGYLSSTAVYADRDGGWIDTHSTADATDDAALRRLRAEQQWQAFAQARGIASAVFRLPALYGRGRTARHGRSCVPARCSTGCTRKTSPRRYWRRCAGRRLMRCICPPTTSRRRRRTCWPMQRH